MDGKHGNRLILVPEGEARDRPPFGSRVGSVLDLWMGEGMGWMDGRLA